MALCEAGGLKGEKGGKSVKCVKGEKSGSGKFEARIPKYETNSKFE